MAMTNDIPRIFQTKRRLCFACDRDKGENDFSERQWVMRRPVCLACQERQLGGAPPDRVAPDPPTLAVVPAAVETRRCGRCKAEKPAKGFSASMWAKRTDGPRWCKECLNAYNRERYAAKKQKCGARRQRPRQSLSLSRSVAPQRSTRLIRRASGRAHGRWHCSVQPGDGEV